MKEGNDVLFFVSEADFSTVESKFVPCVISLYCCTVYKSQNKHV